MKIERRMKSKLFSLFVIAIFVFEIFAFASAFSEEESLDYSSTYSTPSSYFSDSYSSSSSSSSSDSSDSESSSSSSSDSSDSESSSSSSSEISSCEESVNLEGCEEILKNDKKENKNKIIGNIAKGISNNGVTNPNDVLSLMAGIIDDSVKKLNENKIDPNNKEAVQKVVSDVLEGYSLDDSDKLISNDVVNLIQSSINKKEAGPNPGTIRAIQTSDLTGKMNKALASVLGVDNYLSVRNNDFFNNLLGSPFNPPPREVLLEMPLEVRMQYSGVVGMLLGESNIVEKPFESNPDDNIFVKAGKGTVNGIMDLTTGALLSPVGLTSAGGSLPGAAGKVVSGVFGMDMLQGTIEGAGGTIDAIKKGDTQKVFEGVIGTLGSGYLAYSSGKHVFGIEPSLASRKTAIEADIADIQRKLEIENGKGTNPDFVNELNLQLEESKQKVEKIKSAIDDLNAAKPSTDETTSSPAAQVARPGFADSIKPKIERAITADERGPTREEILKSWNDALQKTSAKAVEKLSDTSKRPELIKQLGDEISQAGQGSSGQDYMAGDRLMNFINKDLGVKTSGGFDFMMDKDGQPISNDPILNKVGDKAEVTLFGEKVGTVEATSGTWPSLKVEYKMDKLSDAQLNGILDKIQSHLAGKAKPEVTVYHFAEEGNIGKIKSEGLKAGKDLTEGPEMERTEVDKAFDAVAPKGLSRAGSVFAYPDIEAGRGIEATQSGTVPIEVKVDPKKAVVADTYLYQKAYDALQDVPETERARVIASAENGVANLPKELSGQVTPEQAFYDAMREYWDSSMHLDKYNKLPADEKARRFTNPEILIPAEKPLTDISVLEEGKSPSAGEAGVSGVVEAPESRGIVDSQRNPAVEALDSFIPGVAESVDYFGSAVDSALPNAGRDLIGEKIAERLKKKK